MIKQLRAEQAGGEGRAWAEPGQGAGAFIGLIAIVVVVAMFFTAEYRRGLIRTTLAASPRRGQVLPVKALVAGGLLLRFRDAG